jgi:hypothetical protein
MFFSSVMNNSMKNNSKAFALLFLISFVVLTKVHADISDNLKNHIKYLASEELAGRGTGTDGNKKAAEYIAFQFQKIGIKPWKNAKNYFQELSVITDVQKESDGNMAAIYSPIHMSELNSTMGYTPLSVSDNGSAQAKVVFAGFGISSTADKYDDYEGVDVKNAIVLVLRGAPDLDNPHGTIMQHAGIRSKVMNAKEKGAAGIVIVSGAKYPDSLMPLKWEQGGKVEGIPAIQITRIGLEENIQNLNILELEKQINSSKKPYSKEIPNAEIKFSVNLKQISVKTTNVIGYLPGTDPTKAGEFIVCGAHYDHLGLGGEGSGTLSGKNDLAIHYGADDNASGTAGLIELASILKNRPLSRPVLFIGFTAEERGLLGSAFYVKNPLFSLDSVVFMLNMDMIGRLTDKKLNIGGIGTSSLLKPLIDSLGKEFDFKITTTEDGFGPSDHASFYSKDKPVLFFFTGLHSDYHRPTDTWEKINYEGETAILKMAVSTLDYLGNSAKKPDFIKVKSSPQAGQSMSFRVSLGITPDYSDHPKGMRITGVREGGPGGKAGLASDDIIIKLGDTQVKNVYDYTYALGKFKAGDKTSITVLRGPKEDKEFVLQVEFDAKK